MSLTPQELRHIINLIERAYNKSGKKIETVVKYEGEDSEILIDNREETDIN